MKLDERAATYVRVKWEQLSPDAKRLLGATNEQRMFLSISWERDFYRDVARNYEANADTF